MTLPTHSEERRKEAALAVNRTVSFLKKEGLATDGAVQQGRPDDVIANIAAAKGADLILMGSHGRTGFERVLLGSTTERLLYQTPCAVLVVKIS